MKELTNCIPNSEAKWRRGAKLKSIVKEAIERGYTDIISIEEHHKTPSNEQYSTVPQCLAYTAYNDSFQMDCG